MTTSKENDEDDGGRSFFTSTQKQPPSQSQIPVPLDYDDNSQSLFLSGNLATLKRSRSLSDSQANDDREDNFVATGVSQDLNCDPLDNVTFETIGELKERYALVVSENVKLKKNVANLQEELTILHMMPKVVETVKGLLMECSHHLESKGKMKRRPEQSYCLNKDVTESTEISLDTSSSSDDDFDLEDDPHCAKEGAFPIKKEFIDSLSKTNCKQFILDLMVGLYSRRYLIMHKMTDREATIGNSDKVPMKKYELDQIMEVLDEEFQGVSMREKHEVIRQKFNQNRKRKKKSGKDKKLKRDKEN